MILNTKHQMEFKNRPRKSYYIPGMISLVLLPVLFFIFILPKNRDERALEIMFASKYPSHSDYRPDTSVLSQPKFKRKYTDIILNGDNKEDKKKLDYFEQRIKEIITKNDTLTGVHLVLNDNSTYGTFIQAINICEIHSVARYLPFSNNLWVLNDELTMRRIEDKLKEKKYQEEERIKANLKLKYKSDYLSLGKKIELIINDFIDILK